MRFPKYHIATSVQNRIMNIADELAAGITAQAGLVRPHMPPVTGNPTRQGAILDATIEAKTTQPAIAPPIDAAPDPGASVAGKPLLATMLDPKT